MNQANNLAQVDVPNALMALPFCEQHGEMELQKPGTKEQEFCGTRYQCKRCTSSVLFKSPALTAALRPFNGSDKA